MEGDLRALYIAWLACQHMTGDYEDDNDGEEEEVIHVPAVPPAFATLTAAQQALAELLQMPQELLVAAAQHSKAAMPSTDDDFVAWVKLLPQDRRDDYLVRLAHNESGLSRLLVKELRELGQDKTQETPATGEHVTYTTLLAESKTVKARLERERREQKQMAHQRHLQDIHSRQDDYWHQIDQAAVRGSGAGYDEAIQLLVELREVADKFKESQEFQARLCTWVRPHLRRPALIKRLLNHKFTVPEA